MLITDNEGEIYSFKVSLCGGGSVEDTDLTSYLRNYIPVKELFVFDGCEESDIEE